MPKSLLRLLADRRAVTAVEYALIGAILCLGCVGALGLLGAAVNAQFDAIETQMMTPND